MLDGADGAPLLVLSREGKGRVALLLTDQMLAVGARLSRAAAPMSI